MRTTNWKVACGLLSTVIAASAHAGTITTDWTPYARYQLLASSVDIDLTSAGLGLLNATITAPSATLPAIANATSQTNASTQITKLTSLGFELPAIAIHVDDLSGRILSEDLGGSITFSVATKNGTGSGGYLTLSDLRIDLINNQLTGSVDGGNGVGVKNNVALWSLSGSPNISIANAIAPKPSDLQISCDLSGNGNGFCNDLMGSYLDLKLVPLSPAGMVLTAEARSLWQQSLGYNTIGKAALDATATPGHQFGTLTTAVPEASTWSLMSLGMIGLWGVRTRRNRVVRQA